MGVPWLAHNLKPYASVVQLKDEAVVIDGPGLAYQIYYICLCIQGRARNPFEAIPSYKILGEAVISWLEHLQNYGVVIKKIYFDGFLPSSKQSTRITRLMSYTKQLQNYHESWPQMIPSMQEKDVTQENLPPFLGTAAPSSLLTNLPAAPFIVAAIIEQLLASPDFQDLVEVVPGEADLFCARHVATLGGTVLTSDSDLLVHQIGPGGVIFFKDIHELDSENGKILCAAKYIPAELVEKFALNTTQGLRSLAFEVKIDPHASFKQLIQRSGKLEAINCHPSIYAEFGVEYQPLDKEDANTKANISSLKQKLCRLDPRISEYLLQVPSLARSQHQRQQDDRSDANGPRQVFLPFQLDCPVRTSSWEISVAVRQLAYGLVNLIQPTGSPLSSVVEHRRQQKGAKGREWQLPSLEELPQACDDLLKIFKTVRMSRSPFLDIDFWLTVSIYQSLKYSKDASKENQTRAVFMQGTKSSGTVMRTNWDGIHVYAQLQGCLYSFRLLHQILDIVAIASPPSTMPPSTTSLAAELSTLPPLGQWPSMTESLSKTGAEDMLSFVETAEKLLDIQGVSDTPVVEGISRSSLKKERRRRKREQAASPQAIAQKRTTNKFDLLGTE